MTLAVVLAAGPGTRLRPLTRDRPKSLLCVAGEPILHHLLGDLAQAGVDDVVLVVGHGHQRMRAYLGDGTQYGLRLTYVQQDRQLGPGHAAVQARDAVHAALVSLAAEGSAPERAAQSTAAGTTSITVASNGDDASFLLIPADAWYGPQVLQRLVATKGPAILEVADLRSGRHGTPVLKGDRVVDLEESIGPGDSRVSGGAYRLPLSIFSGIVAHDHSLRDAIRDAIRSGSGWTRVTAADQEYVDIIEPEDLLHLHRLLMESVQTRDDGAREPGVYVQGDVHIGEGTILHAGTVVQGPAHIGKDCSIGPHAVIGPGTSIRNRVRVAPFTFTNDCSIASNITIGSHCRIRDAILDNGVDLGSGSRVEGAATVVGSDAVIGSDVRIEPGAKIGHGARVADGRTVGNVPDDGVAV